MGYSAGILPYTYKNSNLCFLLGKEKSGWSGFSGRCESYDKDQLQTALREFHEETCNIFTGVIDEKYIHDNCIECLESTTPKGNKFYLYILNLEQAFDKTTFNSFTISEEFNHELSSQSECKFKEKSYIRFFNANMTNNIKLRRFFRNDLNKIIELIKK